MPPVQGGDTGGGGGGAAGPGPGSPGGGFTLGRGARFQDPPTGQLRQINYLAVPSGHAGIEGGQDWWDPSPEPDPYSPLLGLTKPRFGGGGGGSGGGFGGEPGYGGSGGGIILSPGPPPPPPPPPGDPGGGGPPPGGGGGPAASFTPARPGQAGGTVGGPDLWSNLPGYLRDWLTKNVLGPRAGSGGTQTLALGSGEAQVQQLIGVRQSVSTAGQAPSSFGALDASGRTFRKEPGYGLPYLEDYNRRLRRFPQFSPSSPRVSNRPR